VRIINRSVLVVVPNQPFLDGLHKADPTSEGLTLEGQRRDPSVYLLPARDMETDLEKCLRDSAGRSLRNNWMDGTGSKSYGHGTGVLRPSENGSSIDFIRCRWILRTNLSSGRNFDCAPAILPNEN
jgi:hypothetical protein